MAYRRDIEDKRRLHKLFVKTNGSCIAGCWYDEDKKRYFKYGKSRGRTSSWATSKKMSRRILRRYSKLTGRWEKKVDDLWWNVY